MCLFIVFSYSYVVEKKDYITVSYIEILKIDRPNY